MVQIQYYLDLIFQPLLLLEEEEAVIQEVVLPLDKMEEVVEVQEPILLRVQEHLFKEIMEAKQLEL